MKTLVNETLRIIIRVALYLYFGGIVVRGKNNIPRDKPLIVVANHQNALLDALLVATQLGLTPYFLTRFDVFKIPVVARMLRYLQLLPVYRMRDGIEHIPKNEETFEQCTHLLSNGAALLIFPEGNHSLERKLRPISKGFTRIAFRTLEQQPDLPLQVLPVGLNYAAHQFGGTKVWLHIGRALAVKESGFDAPLLKSRVKDALNDLISETSVVDDSLPINQSVYPINTKPANTPMYKSTIKEPIIQTRTIVHVIFFPLVLIWLLLKPLIKDPVFYGTFKFLIGLVGVPLYLASVCLGTWIAVQPFIGLIISSLMLFALFLFRYSPYQN
ncbi:Phospholipid/glycerol acyltransferase [Lunatimonas lonarensis]|uniref:Phospholipid/glycerol acyltransferase n=1 Tax=Lunatimonas lonarensis TaxID=1232681 RepID=R7ZRH3_9BACT|nr:1-acyl-sn-glycerol-3-phosphate acyltransferase [Lunatimonas lonarensis]EON76643.1 Phospholipid/glycerol acyltransferase [Lunatimonas lonarensis]